MILCLVTFQFLWAASVHFQEHRLIFYTPPIILLAFICSREMLFNFVKPPSDTLLRVRYHFVWFLAFFQRFSRTLMELFRFLKIWKKIIQKLRLVWEKSRVLYLRILKPFQIDI